MCIHIIVASLVTMYWTKRMARIFPTPYFHWPAGVPRVHSKLWVMNHFSTCPAGKLQGFMKLHFAITTHIHHSATPRSFCSPVFLLRPSSFRPVDSHIDLTAIPQLPGGSVLLFHRAPLRPILPCSAPTSSDLLFCPLMKCLISVFCSPFLNLIFCASPF